MQFEENPIDERFYNSETNAPFETCLVCSKNVKDGGDYFVERIFRKLPGEDGSVEPLFEYAMCQPCAENLRKELSEESLSNIESYFLSKVSRLKSEGISPSTDYCLLTGKAIADSQEFSFHAHCKGNMLQMSLFPYALSDEAMDEISGLLSNDTTDQLDDFKGRFFTGPPEFAELLNPKRLIPF